MQPTIKNLIRREMGFWISYCPKTLLTIQNQNLINDHAWRLWYDTLMGWCHRNLEPIWSNQSNHSDKNQKLHQSWSLPTSDWVVKINSQKQSLNQFIKHQKFKLNSDRLINTRLKILKHSRKSDAEHTEMITWTYTEGKKSSKEIEEN